MADSIEDDKGIKKKPLKSYRSMPKYEVNPSCENPTENTGSGQKALVLKQYESGEKMYLVKGDDWARMPIGLHKIKRVDKAQFAKLYVDVLKTFCRLSPCGTALCEIIYKYIIDNENSNQICLHYNVIKEEWHISDRTYQRALGELLDKEFLYQSNIPHHYWINIGYIFNGDRFNVIQTYACENSAWEEPILPGIDYIGESLN